jgi:hypothetical protein
LRKNIFKTIKAVTPTLMVFLFCPGVYPGCAENIRKENDAEAWFLLVCPE